MRVAGATVTTTTASTTIALEFVPLFEEEEEQPNLFNIFNAHLDLSLLIAQEVVKKN